MAIVEPFRGHVVAAAHARRVVAPPFDTLDEAERRARRDDPDSFLGVLPPRPETGAVLEDCRTHLDRLLASDRFEPIPGPALAVIQLVDGHRTATGVIADVPAAAFEDGTVAPHEQVRDHTVAALREHLEVVGAVSSPVCVAHTPDRRVAELTAGITQQEPLIEVADAAGSLRLWLVTDPTRRDALAAALGGTRDWLIADGHHRAAAAQPWGRVLCALFPDDQLEVLAFHRRAEVEDPADAGARLAETGRAVTEMDGPGSPRRPGDVVVTGGGRWWRVALAELDPAVPPSEGIDAARVEADVLAPLLGAGPGPVGLDDPRVEAVAPTAEVDSLPREGTVTILLAPPTLADVRRVIATGRTMPPKSTYVVPKQRSGVVVVPRGRRLR
jgi:uncharacterized protein (DUF1015 family)